MVLLAANVYPDSEEIQPGALPVIHYTAGLIHSSGFAVDGRSQKSVREALNMGRFLYDSGVEMRYAAERINEEDPRVIAATFGGAPKPVSSGWL